jgi:hypothetical protein
MSATATDIGFRLTLDDPPPGLPPAPGGGPLARINDATSSSTRCARPRGRWCDRGQRAQSGDPCRVPDRRVVLQRQRHDSMFTVGGRIRCREHGVQLRGALAVLAAQLIDIRPAPTVRDGRPSVPSVPSVSSTVLLGCTRTRRRRELVGGSRSSMTAAASDWTVELVDEARIVQLLDSAGSAGIGGQAPLDQLIICLRRAGDALTTVAPQRSL